jgi:radical SAM superfamily enzyme YgiQ (UPF0313 family)
LKTRLSKPMDDSSRDEPMLEPSVHLILVVPMGVDPSIYPWGVRLLADHIRSENLPARVDIWDLSRDGFLEDLYHRHKRMLGSLFALIRGEGKAVFTQHTPNPYRFLGLLAYLGNRYFSIGRCNGLFTGNRQARQLQHKFGDQLDAMQSELRAHLVKEMHTFIERRQDALRIWGFSVYDYTVFNSLLIASLIKEEQEEESEILLGGDYFDFHSGPKLVQELSWIDAVVVGYGEEILKALIRGRIEGISLRELRIEGLINNAGAASSDHEPGIIPACFVPFYCQEPPSRPPIDYVRRHDPAPRPDSAQVSPDGKSPSDAPPEVVVHVLTQRGCSWGHCTFCTQLDRKLYFPIASDYVLEKMRRAINSGGKSDSPPSTYGVSLDSDENDPDSLLSIIRCLYECGDPNTRFHVSGWMKIGRFHDELPELMASSDDRVSLLLGLAVESLNEHTLKTMRKGHTPLQAIQVVKTLIDTKGSAVCNYFATYPLETPKSVIEETRILCQVVHLFQSPSCRLALALYGANSRDTICKNQEQYGIETRRLKGDVWLKEGFGVDLPLSIWAYRWSRKWSWNLESIVEYLNLELQHGYRKLGTDLHAWHGAGGGAWSLARILTSHWRIQAWWLANTLMRVITWNGAHVRRLRILALMAGWTGAARGRGQEKVSWWMRLLARFYLGPVHHEPCRLFIDGDQLHKEWSLFGKVESWSRKLEEKELKVLRHLYRCRNRYRLPKELKDVLSKEELEEIVSRHLRLGSLIEQRGVLLCVANDPGYWQAKDRPFNVGFRLREATPQTDES